MLTSVIAVALASIIARQITFARRLSAGYCPGLSGPKSPQNAEATELRPVCFAAYRARSAWCTMVASSSQSLGKEATPTLTVTLSPGTFSSPAKWKSATARRTFSATTMASSESVSGSTTQNSSPP